MPGACINDVYTVCVRLNFSDLKMAEEWHDSNCSRENMYTDE